jgi:hypothetical protein
MGKKRKNRMKEHRNRDFDVVSARFWHAGCSISLYTFLATVRWRHNRNRTWPGRGKSAASGWPWASLHLLPCRKIRLFRLSSQAKSRIDQGMPEQYVQISPIDATRRRYAKK